MKLRGEPLAWNTSCLRHAVTEVPCGRLAAQVSGDCVGLPAKLKKSAEDDRMMKLYREKPQYDIVPITGIMPAPKPAEKQEEVGSFGN